MFTSKDLPALLLLTALFFAAVGCEDRIGTDSQQQVQVEDEAVQVARAATEWIRENQFVRQYPDSLPVKSSHVRAVAKDFGETIEETRREMRRNHCVGCPPVQRVDPEAFAITWPGGGKRAEKVSEATIRAARGLAEALEKPSGEEASFLDCTDSNPGSIARDKCAIRRDVQSLLSFEEVKVNGDSTAQVEVRWLYKANAEAALLRSDTGTSDVLSVRKMRDMKLVKRNGSWTVEDVLIGMPSR